MTHKTSKRQLVRENLELENYNHYQKQLRTKGGFKDYSDYLNHLARAKGYERWHDYQLAKLKRKGIESGSEHQAKLAAKYGLKRGGEYVRFMADKRRIRPRNKAIARLIADGLKRLGFNKTWLAKQIGVDRSMISYYASGRGIPKEKRLAAIKRSLGVE